MDTVQEALLDMANGGFLLIDRQQIAIVTTLTANLAGEISKTVRYIDSPNQESPVHEDGNFIFLQGGSWIGHIVSLEHPAINALIRLAEPKGFHRRKLEPVDLRPLVDRLSRFDLTPTELGIAWLWETEAMCFVIDVESFLEAENMSDFWTKLPKLPGESTDSFVRNPDWDVGEF